MNYCLRSCLIVLLSFSASLFAQSADNNTTFWQCISQDGAHRQWTSTSEYQKVALNFAYAGCKKQSTIPSTCKAAKDSCQVFINGVVSTPMWKCTALDRMAIAWQGELSSNRDTAALGAKGYCRENSKVPGTCYVNMVTCFNENGQR